MGQLGHGDISDCARPTRVKYFAKSNKRVISAGCGVPHSYALPNKEGPTWYYNKQIGDRLN